MKYTIEEMKTNLIESNLNTHNYAIDFLYKEFLNYSKLSMLLVLCDRIYLSLITLNKNMPIRLDNLEVLEILNKERNSIFRGLSCAGDGANKEWFKRQSKRLEQIEEAINSLK